MNLWIEPKECVKYSQQSAIPFFLGRLADKFCNMTFKDGGYVTSEAPTGLQGLRVMVIDDSKTIRRTAETLLKKEGCEVFTANDGFEALSKIADHHPHIIFVDIMMPRLDGYQTCALIKHNQKFKAIPVIMLSSKDGLFDRARGRIVGSEQYLTKPFTKEELLGAIEQHVLNKVS
jgi:twitching motility two-component system response regulator PilG